MSAYIFTMAAVSADVLIKYDFIHFFAKCVQNDLPKFNKW